MASTQDQTDADHDGDWFLRAVEERATADRALTSHVRGARRLATILLLVAVVVVLFALITAGDRKPSVVEVGVSASLAVNIAGPGGT